MHLLSGFYFLRDVVKVSTKIDITLAEVHHWSCLEIKEYSLLHFKSLLPDLMWRYKNLIFHAGLNDTGKRQCVTLYIILKNKISMPVLELALYTSWASNSQRSSWFCLLSAGIKDLSQQHRADSWVSFWSEIPNYDWKLFDIYCCCPESGLYFNYSVLGGVVACSMWVSGFHSGIFPWWWLPQDLPGSTCMPLCFRKQHT